MPENPFVGTTVIASVVPWFGVSVTVGDAADRLNPAAAATAGY